MMALPIAESTPFFDKTSFTYKIPYQFKMALLDKVNDANFYAKYKRQVLPPNKGRYKNNYKFTIYENVTISLSLYPINSNHNFMRIEYNPAKLGKNGRLKLRSFLIELLGVSLVKNIYFEANLTRIDLTIDDYEMESNIYVYRPGSKTSYIKRKKGAIRSQIIGSGTSDIRVTLYDKLFQQYSEIADQLPYSCYRLEIRYRLRGYTMATLDPSLLDEFDNLRFYRSTFLEDDRFDSGFLKTAYKRGITYAMWKQNDLTRRRYRRYLEDHRIYPINMSDLNFDLAHYYAFRSLIHPDFKDKKMVKKQRSLLQGGVSFRKAS